MSLDYQIKKPEDLQKIDTNDMGELLWWSQILGTTPEKILTTVNEFGNFTEEVRKQLKSNTV